MGAPDDLVARLGGGRGSERGGATEERCGAAPGEVVRKPTPGWIAAVESHGS